MKKPDKQPYEYPEGSYEMESCFREWKAYEKYKKQFPLTVSPILTITVPILTELDPGEQFGVIEATAAHYRIQVNGGESFVKKSEFNEYYSESKLVDKTKQ